MAGLWFSPGTPLSSTIKTDRHDITEILLQSGVKHHIPVFHVADPLNLRKGGGAYFLSCVCYGIYNNVNLLRKFTYDDGI